jgi:acyl-CoA reductase-like NAD-dependent aldehyde dehydrogenase
MKNFIAGHWIDKPKKIEVKNPYDNTIVDTVAQAAETTPTSTTMALKRPTREYGTP